MAPPENEGSETAIGQRPEIRLDETDRNILRILQEDAALPLDEIGRASCRERV